MVLRDLAIPARAGVGHPVDMTSISSPVPGSAAPARLPATLRLGAVHLTVTDLAASVGWYERALGLRLHHREGSVAELGAVAAGQLPPGLSLSTSGRISGTPTTTGTFAFTAAVSDDAGARTTRQFSIAVS